MIPVLVLTHGDLATELLAAAIAIDPDLAEQSRALALPWDVNTDDAAKMLDRTLREMGAADGALILTDMFGGTATNLALPRLDPGRIEIVTGVNLPMLVKIGSLRGRELAPQALAERVASAGQKSIRLASEFLRSRAASEPAAAGDAAS